MGPHYEAIEVLYSSPDADKDTSPTEPALKPACGKEREEEFN